MLLPALHLLPHPPASPGCFWDTVPVTSVARLSRLASPPDGHARQRDKSGYLKDIRASALCDLIIHTHTHTHTHTRLDMSYGCMPESTQTRTNMDKGSVHGFHRTSICNIDNMPTICSPACKCTHTDNTHTHTHIHSHVRTHTLTFTLKGELHQFYTSKKSEKKLCKVFCGFRGRCV